MTRENDGFWNVFWRLVIEGLKIRAIIALAFFGVLIFGIVVQIVDPVQQELSTFELRQLHQQEIAAARREGRYPNFQQFEPFDNFQVTGYLVPLFGIWMMSRLARWRKRLPVSFFLMFMTLGLGWWLASYGGDALYDLYGSLSDSGNMSDRNRARSWVFIVMMIILVPVLSVRWLRRGPAWFDSLLRVAPPPQTAHETLSQPGIRISAAGWRLLASALVCAPVLWVIYDRFDGGAIPGPFALGVRALFVIFALWLMMREQIEAARSMIDNSQKETLETGQPTVQSTVTPATGFGSRRR